MTAVRVTNRDTGFWYKDYKSLSEAAKDLGVPQGSISRCLQGLYKFSGNYTYQIIKKEDTK